MNDVCFPVYIPSRSRFDLATTPAVFIDCGVKNFFVVVEPHEANRYSVRGWPMLVLPDDDRGITFSRNWIKEHARAAGAEWHWQVDDDINRFYLNSGTSRARVGAAEALAHLEEVVSRYSNVAAAALAHSTFPKTKPLCINHPAYTCSLIRTADPFKWRIESGVYEDTDYALQILAAGLCTIVSNVYEYSSLSQGRTPGGMRDRYALHPDKARYVDDLAALWPGVVEHRLRRGVHGPAVRWRTFTTRLKAREEEM